MSQADVWQPFSIKQLRDMIYYQENIEYNQIFHGSLIL